MYGYLPYNITKGSDWMPSKDIARIEVRCSPEDKEAITKKWKEYGFKSESEYIRFVALNAEITVKANSEKEE